MTKFHFILPLLILKMLLIIFIITTNSIHPIHFIILLIFYSIITCILMSIWKFTYIYSIIIFLIIIRGLLIIFIYFARLVSNEQSKIIWNILLLTNLSLNSIFFLWFINLPPQSNLTFIPYSTIDIIPILKINIILFQNITKIYIYPYFNLTLIRIFYLLISLFLVIKITSIKSSSLRKIHY